jgi:N-carbamoylputrescine amidase
MTSSTQLTIALLQHPVQTSTKDTYALLEREIASCATAGAKLVVLQELHNGPYFCQTEDVAQFDRAEAIPGTSTDFLGRLAKLHQVVIVGSLFERRAAGLYHNCAVVLEIDGSLAGTYRKMHIPDDPGFYEKFYFTPGDADGQVNNGTSFVRRLFC